MLMKRLTLLLTLAALLFSGIPASSQTAWKEGKKTYSAVLEDGLTVKVLTNKGKVRYQRTLERNTLEENPGELTIVLPMETVHIGNGDYLHFAYLNGNTEYVEVRYRPKEDILHQAMFYGTPIKGEPFAIEGQMAFAEAGIVLPPVLWLTERIKENPCLVELSNEDYLSDKSIKWWLEHNPSGVADIKFSSVSEDSSIAAAFKKARKEKGKGCTAALLEVRGYTLVCANRNGSLVLIWCEPAVKTGKRLEKILFSSDNTTLDLIYYKGNTVSKNKISTVSGHIRRF